MKFGIRKPNLKKSLKAKTTGKAKRAMKSAIDPTYGKKGAGLIKNPGKSVYNKVYNKTTVGVSDILDTSNEKPGKKPIDENEVKFMDENKAGQEQHTDQPTKKIGCGVGCLSILIIMTIIAGVGNLIETITGKHDLQTPEEYQKMLEYKISRSDSIESIEVNNKEKSITLVLKVEADHLLPEIDLAKSRTVSITEELLKDPNIKKMILIYEGIGSIELNKEEKSQGETGSYFKRELIDEKFEEL